MPAHVRLAPYRLPSDDGDEEDAILKAAIEEAELARTPAYRTRQATTSFYRAHAAMPCPYVNQNYEQLGSQEAQACKGAISVKSTGGHLWFLGCTEYNNKRGHRFKPIPPSVDHEMLAAMVADPVTADNNRADAPACFFMESRWARRHTCPLEPQAGLDLIPSGEREDGSCPVRLTLYTFDRPALAQCTVIAVTGEHTHPRGIRAIPRGHLRSRVFELLNGDPTTTRAQIARTIREELNLRPNSSAIAHAHADYRLERNPLGEDQVGVMARLAASLGAPQYVRKTVFGATGEGGAYSYVTFLREDMAQYAAMQASFCADLSFKDFDPLSRLAAADGQWHMFSITTWCERLQRTVTVFKAATIGESEGLYRELFGEFLRACGVRGQLMPAQGDAVTMRTATGVRQRELVSITLDFCVAQAQGAAFALAEEGDLASTTDAARAFLRGCQVHYKRSTQKLPLDRDGADADLWGRLRDAPMTVRDADAAGALLQKLKAHSLPAVRNWAAWASKPIIREMIFTAAYSRIGPDLLPSVPCNTNIQESSHRANVLRCHLGTLLSVIEEHELMDTETMGRVHGMGSGGSEHTRPHTQERRFTIAHNRAVRARDKRTAPREPVVIRPPHPDTDEDTIDDDHRDPQSGAGGNGPRRPGQAGASAAGGGDDPPGLSQRTDSTGGSGPAGGTHRAAREGAADGRGAGAASGGACAPSPTTPGCPTPPVFRPALPPEASLTTALGGPPAVPAALLGDSPAPTTNPMAPATQRDISRLLAMVAHQDRLLQSLLRDRNPQQGAAQAAGSVLSDAASSPKRQDGLPAGPA